MNKNKLAKLIGELESLRKRKRNITGREIVGFAKRCGRQMRTGGKGKEPTYINKYLPYRMPLSIPYHTGNMPVGTAGSILDMLEQDLFELEDILERQSRGAK